MRDLLKDPLPHSTPSPVQSLDALRFLAEAGSILSSSLDTDETLRSLARLIVPELADWCSVHLVDEAGPRQLTVEHVDPKKIQLLLEMQQRYPEKRDETQGLGKVLATGESELIEEIPPELLAKAGVNAEHQAFIDQLGLRSYLSVPLKLHGRILGAISVASAESRRRFGQADLQLVEELAGRAAQALENARLFGETEQTKLRLQLALDAGRLGAWEFDLSTQRVTWSPGTERIHGIEEGSFPGTYEAWQSDMHPDDRERVLQAVRATLEGRSADYGLKYRIIRPDGEIRWIEARGEVTRDAAGQPLGLTGVCSDITDRAEAEARERSLMAEQIARREAERAKNQIAEILASISDPFLVLDREGRITYVNEPAQSWPGSAGAQLGEKLFGGEEVAALVEEACVASMRELRRETREAFFPTLQRWFQVTAYPMAEGFSVYARDITDRRAAEQELETRARDLARSNAELEQFAYVASHDLQEPLRMVASYVQLLARRYKGKLDGDADEFIGFAVDGVTRMQALIQDLLAFSRVGTKGKPFRDVSLESVLTSAAGNLRLLLDESGAELTHDPLPNVHGDDAQLVQLLQNLLANALKFRGDAPPRLHISAKTDEREATISVSDNGIGIAPEYFDRIFIIFQRLHGRSEYPGNGIGLAICRKVVERHQGRIWVESEPGKGTTFSFTLPLANA